MSRNRFKFFPEIDQPNDDSNTSWFGKIASLLTTHNQGWVTTNQATNLLSAAYAGYVLVTRPHAITTLAPIEFVTHLSQGLFVRSQDSSTHDKLILLNVLDIMYSTCYHLAYQNSNLAFAAAMTELLAAHLMGNIWMNVVQASKSDGRDAEKSVDQSDNDTSYPAIARLT